MIPNRSVPIIPVPWSRLRRVLALTCLCACGVPAQQLETVAQRYRKTPNARTRAAVLRYAELHRKDQSGALAYLVLGATEIDQRQFGDAQRHLTAAEKRLPQLADYIAYLTAESEFEQRQFPATEAALQTVWQASPASALIAKAAVLQANSYLQNNQADQAAALITRRSADLSVPQAELLLARAYEAAGNAEAAAAALPEDLRTVPVCQRSLGCRSRSVSLSCLGASGAARPRTQAGGWRRLHARRQGTDGAAPAVERRGPRSRPRAHRRGIATWRATTSRPTTISARSRPPRRRRKPSGCTTCSNASDG